MDDDVLRNATNNISNVVCAMNEKWYLRYACISARKRITEYYRTWHWTMCRWSTLREPEHSKTNFGLYSYLHILISHSLRAIVILLSSSLMFFFFTLFIFCDGLQFFLSIHFCSFPFPSISLSCRLLVLYKNQNQDLPLRWIEMSSRLATILLTAVTLNPLCPMVSPGWMSEDGNPQKNTETEMLW